MFTCDKRMRNNALQAEKKHAPLHRTAVKDRFYAEERIRLKRPAIVPTKEVQLRGGGHQPISMGSDL